MARTPRDAITYILPIRSAAPHGDELAGYLHWLTGRSETIVVDGSPPAIFAAHATAWHAALARGLRHLPPAADLMTPMGKVGSVLTGLRLASHEHVIIADDDVRYDNDSLAHIARALRTADVVRPQNYFSPQPWHARWDTGRMLLNRLTGGDWPGTLGVRRSVLRATGGYDGRALFENLELVRTVIAAGGREAVLRDVYVLRRPSTTRHFWSQRIRQAYDELARPGRLAIQLAVLPATVTLAATAQWGALAIGVLAIMLAAEAGRWRAGGRRVFAATASLLAPAWVAERAVCSWLALGSRVCFGGVRYRGTVLRHPATPMRELLARHAAARHAMSRRKSPSARRRGPRRRLA
ncbi:MAG TPA: glycosyltransferase family 2 protein [Gemmatimonadaceae bacterium]|nr:glycosyltransferase family 2 protein [Gemmatimonadaceae bacterium]